MDKGLDKDGFDDYQFYQGDEDIPSRIINYGDTITRQTNITTYFLTKAYTHAELVIAANAVDVLESLVIRQAKDQIYQDSLSKLYKNTTDRWNKLSQLERRRLFTHYKRQYILSKFRLLADLMARAGLSYIQDASVVLGETKHRVKKPKIENGSETPEPFDEVI